MSLRISSKAGRCFTGKRFSILTIVPPVVDVGTLSILNMLGTCCVYIEFCMTIHNGMGTTEVVDQGSFVAFATFSV